MEQNGQFQIQKVQGPLELCDRLREIGLVEGESIQVTVFSHLVQVSVGNTSFALRKSEFSCLQLQKTVSNQVPNKVIGAQ